MQLLSRIQRLNPISLHAWRCYSAVVGDAGYDAALLLCISPSIFCPTPVECGKVRGGGGGVSFGDAPNGLKHLMGAAFKV